MPRSLYVYVDGVGSGGGSTEMYVITNEKAAAIRSGGSSFPNVTRSATDENVNTSPADRIFSMAALIDFSSFDADGRMR